MANRQRSSTCLDAVDIFDLNIKQMNGKTKNWITGQPTMQKKNSKIE